MKKMLVIIFSLLAINVAYALVVHSNKSGAIVLSEPQLQVGDKAPKISLMTSDHKKITVGGATGKVQLISSIENLSDPISDKQTKQLSTVAKYLKDLQIAVVTLDAPSQINAFKIKNKINNIQILSTSEADNFAKTYGVKVVRGGLKNIMGRAVFVVNKEGIIAYKEVVAEIDELPNIRKAAITAAGKM